MIHATLLWCSNNPAPTAAIPAFATAKAAVESKMLIVNSLGQVAARTTKGVTLDTVAMRTAMTAIAFRCASALSSFAATIGNNELREKVNFTERSLNKMRKLTSENTCQIIHDAANSNLAAIADYGCPASVVSDLQTAINLYHSATPNPRLAIISRAQAIARIDSIVREVMDKYFKNQMDLMVRTLQASDPFFVNGYFGARQIIDLGTTTAKVRGIVTADNNKNLEGVKFVIRKTADKALIAETLTTAEGKFNISKLLPGDYDFTWSLSGYKTITETNVHISAGKELRRKLTMLRA